MLGSLRATLHPARYHGLQFGERPPFFEGWYYKIVDASEQFRFAIIPGIFWSSRPHSFIQVLDGISGETTYHTYPVEAFWPAGDRFEIHVGPSRFTLNEIDLLIDSPEQRLRGTLTFGSVSPWPVTLASPGIMGWYAWVPFMECYHGVLSLDHTIHGRLEVGGEAISFDDGRGYIEKDWGRSFPEAWIWLQSNHFQAPGTSLTASIAIIPWILQAFRGFIVGLWHQDRLYRFATYTGAVTESLAVTDDAVDWVVRNRRRRLTMRATRGAGSRYGLLKGPDTLEMGKRVAETLSAVVDVRLEDIGGGTERVIFEGRGRNAGLEVHNARERLLELD